MFNRKPVQPKLEQTTNEAGGLAYEMTERQKLINFALNANFQGTFYKTADEQLKTLQNIIRNTKDPLFAAKLAVWARNEHGARAVSHVICAELIKKFKGVDWMKKFVNAVIYRPDDALNILAYYQHEYGKRPIPNSFKKGVSDAFMAFDEYQFAKYKKTNSEISLRDLVILTHPRPSIKNHIAIEKLLNGTLKQVNTAQAKLSDAGKQSSPKEVKEARTEAFNDLINEKKLGYSALITNFIDILFEASDAEFDKACEYMVNPVAIKNSLMYPMKYYILYTTLKSGMVSGAYKKQNRIDKGIKAINTAMELAFKNMPNFEGKRILLAQDVSGSMSSSTVAVQHGTGKNAIAVPTRCSEYAAMFAVALLKSDNSVDYMQFNSTAKYVNVNKLDSFITLVKELTKANGGTSFTSVFNMAEKAWNEKHIAYDIIITISDNESWGHRSSLQEALNQYRRTVNKNTTMVSWDLDAKDTQLFNEKKFIALCGYSAKVFDVLGQAVNEEAKIEKQIEAVSFDKYITTIAPWTGGKTTDKKTGANACTNRSCACGGHGKAPATAKVKPSLMPKTDKAKAVKRATKSL